MNQRWLEGHDSYRPPTERIRTSEYDVALMGSDLTARSFVERHHYSHSYPAARVRVGLYRRGELAGVAVFSHPCNDLVLTNTFGQVEAVELGRFVLLDEVPGNGETWFLARCFEQLRAEGFGGVVSFSDPMPRADIAGRVVFPGHIGTIYQAHNARYLGRSASRQRRLLPDGTVFNRRTEQKIRGAERGWRGAVEQLVGYGADSLSGDASFADRIAWLESWRSRLTRSIRHPGNHRYAWPLYRRVVLPTGLLYPKAVAA